MSKGMMDAALDRVEWKAVPAPADVEGDTPYPTHEGVWEFFGHKIRCYQLSNGQRVMNAEDVEQFFGNQPK